MSARDRLFARVFVGTLLLSGCGDDPEPQEEEKQDPFVAAAALDSTFCVNAQRSVAGFDATSLPDVSVTQVSLNMNDFVSSRADVVDGVLKLQATLVPYTNPVAPAGASLSHAIACKLRSQEAIESLLGLDAGGAAASCRAAHQEAWDWARSQLTQEERERYETTGHKLSLAEDVASAVGPQWIASNAVLTKNGEDYTLAASALVSPGTGDFSDGTQGAIYCKLWTPAQMLYWLRVRAFDADPTANEPKAPDPKPSDCTPGQTTTGSCTFLFAVASSHFCEDYSGSGWTSESSQAKCTMRGGTYSTEPCASRKAETDTFDGDGVFKGQCVLKCGTPDEYVWNTYSGAGDGSGCGTGSWIPAGSM